MKLEALKNKISKFSQNPGVYVFKNKNGEILYVGKATSLKTRVSSYFKFQADSNLRMDANLRIANRPIEAMTHEVTDIRVQETDSILEALILESNLIKKLQPKYNVKEKDDKSFVYAVITEDKFPRIVILRKTDLDLVQSLNFKVQNYSSKLKVRNIKAGTTFGPYTSKKQLEVALKIIRKIFPYHSNSQKTEKGCLDFQMGRCPGPYAGAITLEDYKKNISGIRMILEGKKKSLVKRMEKEMKNFSAHHEYEKAAELRNKIFALQHIQDVALISADMKHETWNMKQKLRIEAYDISNISGQHATGSMVVFKNSEPDKSQYRKFKIRTIQSADDVGMMREVIFRRFKNNWPQPDLIFLDGGRGHLNMGKKLLDELGMKIPVMAIAKGAKRKNLELRISNLELESRIKDIVRDKKLIKCIMDEAHRFAIGYHKKLRHKNTLS